MYIIDLRVHFLYTISMIYSYSCKNFYSINDKVEVRFDVNRNAPDTASYKVEGNQKLSLVEAVVGPNASGKTNSIKAISFIRHLIAETAERDVDADIPVHTFLKGDSPTEVGTKFSVNGRVFSYDFELCSERILKEVLKEQSLSEERVTFKTLLSRTWNKKTQEYEVVDNAFKAPSGLKWRRNASMVSRISLADESGLAVDIVRYWRDNVVTNVWEGGNRDDHHHLHGDRLTESAIEFLFKEENKTLLDQAKDLLANLDVGFHDFESEELKIEGRKVYRIVHMYGDTSFSTPLRYESSGTKRAILILRYIFEALSRSGGVAALDEIDAYLHPDIVEVFVKLFTSSVTNPNGAQLIFSSHSHQLLAELDKQQIILVEKSDAGATDAWRLDEVTGVRADDNYYNKYIAGAYGGKPKIKV